MRLLMNCSRLCTACVVLFTVCALHAQSSDNDLSAHASRFVEVGDNIKLEVLDWGGKGRPLILLPGLGDTAHVFDKFAL